MNGTRRRPGGDPVFRLRVTAAVAATVTLFSIGIAISVARPSSAGTGQGASADGVTRAYQRASTGSTAKPAPVADRAAEPSAAATPTAGAGSYASVNPSASKSTAEDPGNVSLTLTAVDRAHCPAKATACVDLTRHITWMQKSGKVSFGPVQMEPGHPTGDHQTPRGTFHVSWKAGPGYVSNIYHEPMPWATFFAAGGIAFHGGPLSEYSHGCVHLTTSNAHYYSQHLPVGAEVVVF